MEEQRSDLVLLYLVSPGIDGIELMKDILGTGEQNAFLDMDRLYVA